MVPHDMHHIPSQPNLDFSTPQRALSLRFWWLIVVTGAIAGLVGGLLMQLLRTVERFAWNMRTDSFFDAANQASIGHRIVVVTAAGLLVGVGRIVGRKLLKGSSEVDSAIWFRSGKISLPTALFDAVQSIIVVGMGASLGRESAVKQAGGAIASQLARWCELSRPEQRLLVACGVGAGMAAAYNVPVGGALFAIEVLIGSLSLRLVLPALLCSAVATGTSWIFLPTGPVYDVPEYALSISLVIWSIWAGPLLGLMTAILIRAIAWAETHKPKTPVQTIVAPVVTLFALGLASVAFPQLLGNGQDLIQLAFTAKIDVSLLLILPLLKTFATTGCLASGARGGLFTPTMTIGALLGGLLGSLWDRVLPGSHLGCYAEIGGCAFLAGSSQAPLSALVIVLELTRHVDSTMVPMLLALTGAMLVARRIEARSIYSLRIRSTNSIHSIPKKEAISAAPHLEHLISRDVSIISSGAGYLDLVQGLWRAELHFPIYVVDHEGCFLGTIDATCLEQAPMGPLPPESIRTADLIEITESIDSQQTLAELKGLFEKGRQSAFPVVDRVTGQLIGTVSRNDLEHDSRSERR